MNRTSSAVALRVVDNGFALADVLDGRASGQAKTKSGWNSRANAIFGN